MDENSPSRYLTTLNTALTSISNPCLSMLKDGAARQHCSERARELRKKTGRNVSDELNLHYYSLMANADIAKQGDLLTDLAAAANGCLLKFRRHGTDHLLTLFGLVPGSVEAEAVKAKEFASVLLQETQRTQADLETKLASSDTLLRASADALTEARHEIAALQTQLAEVQNARTSETADLRADLEKTRTELQTALTPKAVEAFDNMVQDAVTVKALAEARALIDQQQKLIIKYRSMVSSKFDEEYVDLLDWFLRHHDDPSKKLEAEAVGYKLMHSILSKE